MRYVYKIFIRKKTWDTKDYEEKYLKTEIACEGVEWIHLIHNGIQWQAPL
jgi:hypothetical protein